MIDRIDMGVRVAGQKATMDDEAVLKGQLEGTALIDISQVDETKNIKVDIITPNDGTRYLAGDGQWVPFPDFSPRDETVKISSTDATAGYLADKLTSTDGSVIITDEGSTLDLSATGGGGGSETVNIETLAADKTLTASDATIQILQTGSANRIVNLPTTGLTIGQKFVIWNNDVYSSSYYIDVIYIIVKDRVYSQKKTEFYWDGTNWYYSNDVNVAIGFDANGSSYGAAVGRSAAGYDHGAALGINATGSSHGVALGQNATGSGYGAALGFNAAGYSYGVALGSYANGRNYGTALGYQANTNLKQSGTVAIGAYSKAERNREIVSTASDTTTNKAQMTIQKYKEIDIPNNASTWVEFFIDASLSRLVLLSNSVYNFFGELNCYRIATNDNILYPIGAVKGWQFTGLIKNVAGVVSLVGTPTKTLLGCDPDGDIGNVDMRIEADDTNNSLKLSVYIPLGSGGQIYRFSGNIFASETRV